MLKRVRNKNLNRDINQSKECLICKKVFYKPTFQSFESWKKSKFCSKSCYWKTVSNNMKGISHPCKRKGTGKGWLHKATGYMVMIHPVTGRKILMHRYIMEKYIGRSLEKYEHIHHKNGNKADNRIENLILISQVDHMKLHNVNRDMAFNKNKKIKKCFKCGKRFFSHQCKCK